MIDIRTGDDKGADGRKNRGAPGRAGKPGAAAGIDDVQWRDWRRKAGSDTTEAHASELLDHSTPAVTRRHYRAAPKRVAPIK